MILSGSETSRAGLAMLFEMLQFPSLNKRLVIVILEGVIKTVFPEQVGIPVMVMVNVKVIIIVTLYGVMKTVSPEQVRIVNNDFDVRKDSSILRKRIQ